jgi:hypothetical protein
MRAGAVQPVFRGCLRCVGCFLVSDTAQVELKSEGSPCLAPLDDLHPLHAPPQLETESKR